MIRLFNKGFVKERQHVIYTRRNSGLLPSEFDFGSRVIMRVEGRDVIIFTVTRYFWVGKRSWLDEGEVPRTVKMLNEGGPHAGWVREEGYNIDETFGSI